MAKESKSSVRLDLKADGFRRELRKIGEEVESVADDIGRDLSEGMNEGAKGALKALGGLFNGLKSVAAGVGGLLGGVGLASLVDGTIKSQQGFKQLTFRMREGTGQAMKWRDVQKQVQQVALSTKTDVDGLGKALEAAFQETGSAEQAQGSLEAIANTVRVTGAEFETVGKLAGVLQQKFGISTAGIGDQLAQMVASANSGGGTLEDFADDFAEIGGKAKTLGLVGPEGIRKMLGLLNLAKKETGNFSQAMTALPQIFDAIIERGGAGGDLAIKYKIETVGADGKPRDPFDIIADIIAKTEGSEAKLGELGFGGEGLQTLLALAKPFKEELKATGGDIESASKVLETVLQENAGQLSNYNDILAEAAETTPADDIQDAINRLKIAFTQPEIIGAIEKLAKALPKFADAVAGVLDFVMDSPAAAAGVIGGGVALKGGLSATMDAAIRNSMAGGGKSAASEMKGGIESGGKKAGSTIGASIKGAMAVAAAQMAIALAVDQALKLGKDLDTMGQDQSDERTNLLEAAERQGKSTATRKRSLAERIFAGGTPDDIFNEEEVIYRDPKTGAVKTRAKTASDRELEENPVSIPMQAHDIGDVGPTPSAADVARNVRRAEGFSDKGIDRVLSAEKQYGPMSLGEEKRIAAGEDPATVFKAASAKTETAVKTGAQKTVTAIKSELKVRIVNPEDIRPKTGPVPGNGERD